jgi:quercetin dioxygenase-like cupin family protein
MDIVALESLEERELVPGYRGRFVHSAHVTLAYWSIRAQAALPEHAHPHEQVVNLLEGTFQLTVGDETAELGAGRVVVIPPRARHSGMALTDCRILDVFYPIRDDYR